MLSIPPDVRPQAVISLGYPDETPNDRSLVPVENITFFNRYGMKIERLHVVLRDYSVEWQRQGNKLSQRLNNAARKIKEQYNKISERLKKKK